jgi:acyl carrier protein
VSNDPVLDDVVAFLADDCGVDRAALTRDTPLITGGHIDSLSVVRLVAFLERHFGIALPAFDVGIENLDTLARIAELVRRRRGD